MGRAWQGIGATAKRLRQSPDVSGFTGRRWDEETALYYYRARMYNPQIGRFCQTDPIGYADGINWYAYCGNNPVMLVDPYGLWQITAGAGWWYAGRITFAYNHGDWNLGFAVGGGLGAMVSVTPADADPGFASEGDSYYLGAEVSGGTKLYNIGVSGGVEAIGTQDNTSNVELDAGLKGGLSFPKIPIPLEGKAGIIVQGNVSDASYSRVGFQAVPAPISYGIGAMIFGGVSGGKTWDTQPAQHNTGFQAEVGYKK